MIRRLLLLVLCGSLVGMTCQAPVLECSNALDASQFGFTLTVPDAYACAISASPFMLQSQAEALVIYQDASTNRSLIVMVLSAAAVDAAGTGQQSTGDDNVQYDDLDAYVSANGIQFEMRKGTSTDDANQVTGIAYFAVAQVSEGTYYLSITIDAPNDDAAVRTTLNTVLDSVQETGGA